MPPPLRDSSDVRQCIYVGRRTPVTRAWYLARREAEEIRYVSHEEAGRRLGLPSR